MSLPHGTNRNTFSKREHLCSRKRLEILFGSKDSVRITRFPLRCVWRKRPADGASVQVVVSVGKRYFKHAVDRNLIKRRIREAYRLNKHQLLQHLNEQNLNADAQQTGIDLSFVWLADELFDFKTIETKVRQILNCISERI